MATKVWDKQNQWSEEIELLKSIVNKTNLVETTKWGGIVYTYNDKNVWVLAVSNLMLVFGFLMVFT